MRADHGQTSDEALVRRVLEGDSKAFESLIERHFGVVYAVALARLRDPDQAEDLAQEVFLRVHLHLGQFDPRHRFGAWVARIARNLAIDWLRRGQRASRLVPLVPLEGAAAEAPNPREKGARETMASDEEARALRRAILDLPAELREVVLLHFSEDLTQSEIAERLGLHQATVSRQLKRALAMLRGALEPTLRGVGPSLRAPRQAVAKSILLASAVGAMSATAKASLAASATVGEWASAAEMAKVTAAGTVGVVGFLQSLPALIAGGGKAMATGKGIAATIAAAVLIGGGAMIITQGDDVEDRIVSEVTEEGVYALTPTDEVIALGRVDPEIGSQLDTLEHSGSETAGAEAADLLRGLGLPTVSRDLRLLLRDESVVELDPSGSPYDIDIGRIEELEIIPHQIEFREVAPGLFEGVFETPPGGDLLTIWRDGDEMLAWAAWLEGEEPPSVLIRDTSDLDLRSPSVTLTEFVEAMVNGDRRQAEDLFADLPTINAALEELGRTPMTPEQFESIVAERERRIETLADQLRRRSIHGFQSDWDQQGSRRDVRPSPLRDNARLTLIVDGQERTIRFDEMVLRGGQWAWDEGQMVDLADGTQARQVGHWVLEEGEWMLIEGPVLE
ncbi:sigma-70 family RNA polymerase sigma factor [Candidatus Sumerlaeota bacterium]|nr:sigma-70 family RNA polymerase sigma factor [Candidatus Sumerlaeota bacterium]